ncbi:MAG: response regulator transcription factor [Alphaproteobacteria bacterium]|nr:response regulator transcription factor [Alphaproteobacteria bacterium]
MALLDRVDGDVAIHHQLARGGADRRLRIVNPVAVDARGQVTPMVDLDGVPYTELGVDLATAPPFDSFGLARIAELPAEARQALSRTVGDADLLSVHLRDGMRYLGSVSVFRNRGRRALDAADKLSADAVVPALLDALRDEGMRAAALSRHTAVVFSGDGRPRFGTFDANPLVIERIGALASSFLAGDGSHERVVQGVHVTFERLIGEGTEVVLASCAPTEPMQIVAPMLLTPRKRRIAQAAMRGATVSEIAKMLGRGDETVRTHLKRIYEVLGVASRVELAEACRDLWL